MTKPIYVLGTGLSHNGSAVLLKDGKVEVAIEKERLTRIKHDGGNDTQAIEYCLATAGISLNDIELVVQCENFIYPKRDRHKGERLFANHQELPLINISHHLAHAYSAVGTSPFEQSHVLVVDGCGSPYEQVIDKDKHTYIPEPTSVFETGLYCEKDSFYYFDGDKLSPLVKDYSEFDISYTMPTTLHSIGGFYSFVSNYVFGDMDDVGKLMGLAPFGTNKYQHPVFYFENDGLKIHQDWRTPLTTPSNDYQDVKRNFQHYADIAAWAQTQVTSAVTELVAKRMQARSNKNLCYSGGVALNIVANTQLLQQGLVENLYVEPAAGDNGIALGCAYYGWHELLKKPLLSHDGSTCFGKHYDNTCIDAAITQDVTDKYQVLRFEDEAEMLKQAAQMLAEGKILAWFQGGSEFGPRALGKRSILAHPGIPELHQRINKDVKLREDFRPFAPAVLLEDAAEYFEAGRISPYMLAIDHTKAEYAQQLVNVTHKDNSARVQTVEPKQDPKFAGLIRAFKQQTGLGVLLNTSLNQRGEPIVETPEQAVAIFQRSALDALVMGNVLIRKVKSE